MYQNLEAEIARRKNEFNKTEFAKKIGMTLNTLNNKIDSKSDWTLSEVQAICKIFPDLKIDYLFEKTNKE